MKYDFETIIDRDPAIRGTGKYRIMKDSKGNKPPKGIVPLSVADMEFRILSLFVRYPNTFFTANELYQKIWGKESLGDVRTVQVHIHNLRRAAAFRLLMSRALR